MRCVRHDRVIWFCYRCAVDRGQGGTPPRSLLQGKRQPDVSVSGLEPTLFAFLIRSSSARTPPQIVGARLPAICREPAARLVHAECQAESSRLILLPLRGRSSGCGPDTSHAPTGTASTRGFCFWPGANALRFLDLIVPTLRVVTQRLTLRVNVDAERPGRHSNAERGNDRPVSSALRYPWETSEVTRVWAALRTNAVGQAHGR